MKIAFIDRDGTIIQEPKDFQVDRLDKIRLVNDVIPALRELREAGYVLVMVSNQDGLGTDSFPQEDFDLCQNFLLDLLASQGVLFENSLICPHRPEDVCDCRKPKVGLVLPYLRRSDWDRENSFVVGDRDGDRELAEQMGLNFFRVHSPFAAGMSWPEIVRTAIHQDRSAFVERKTRETSIAVRVNLDRGDSIRFGTGIGFFDHMLEQLARHAGISLEVEAQGDLHIDEHHTVEDVALVLGQALKKALGDKRGISRYGFTLPMDEAFAEVLLDLGGRSLFVWDVTLHRERVGGLATEMIPHFFRSLSDTLGANLHVRAQGDNDHHIVESIFKAFARTLRQAIKREGTDLPSSKGLL